MLKRFIRHWAVKARALQTRRKKAKAPAIRRREAQRNMCAPIPGPDALPEHDPYDDVIEASFPASDPPPYVRDPIESSSHR